MGANVIPLVTQLDVDRAWEAYQYLVVEALDKPALFADRGHMERMAHAHARFTQLYMADSYAGNVVGIGVAR